MTEYETNILKLIKFPINETFEHVIWLIKKGLISVNELIDISIKRNCDSFLLYMITRKELLSEDQIVKIGHYFISEKSPYRYGFNIYMFTKNATESNVQLDRIIKGLESAIINSESAEFIKKFIELNGVSRDNVINNLIKYGRIELMYGCLDFKFASEELDRIAERVKSANSINWIIKFAKANKYLRHKLCIHIILTKDIRTIYNYLKICDSDDLITIKMLCMAILKLSYYSFDSTYLIEIIEKLHEIKDQTDIDKEIGYVKEILSKLKNKKVIRKYLELFGSDENLERILNPKEEKIDKMLQFFKEGNLSKIESDIEVFKELFEHGPKEQDTPQKKM